MKYSVDALSLMDSKEFIHKEEAKTFFDISPIK